MGHRLMSDSSSTYGAMVNGEAWNAGPSASRSRGRRRKAASSIRAGGSLLLVFVAAGAVAGYVVGANTQPVHAATTTLLVGDTNAPGLTKDDIQTTDQVTTIYGRLIRSQAVLDPVIERLGMAMSWEQLKDNVHVDLGANEVPLIYIIVYGGSGSEVRAIADAISHRAVELGRSGLNDLPMDGIEIGTGEMGEIEQIIAQTELRLSALQAKMSSAHTLSDQARLQTDWEEQSKLIMAWQDVYASRLSSVDGSVNGLRVLQPAEARAERIRPLRRIDVGLGALIGALVALGVIMASIALRTPPRTAAGDHAADPFIAQAVGLGHKPALLPASPVGVSDRWVRELAHSIRNR